MLFNGLDHLRVKRAAAIGDTKGTIIDMSASPAGNLRHLRRRQSAHPPSIIFDIGRQRDMAEIQIESHADRIGRNQEINIAILVEINLRIAGTRAEPAHDNSRPTTLAAHEISDLVDISDAKGNDRAARQARQLARAGIGQL